MCVFGKRGGGGVDTGKERSLERDGGLLILYLRGGGGENSEKERKLDGEEEAERHR